MSRPAAALATALLLAMTGCGSDDGGSSASSNGVGSKAASSSATVDIKDFKFGPQDVSVKRGGTVTWTNTDDPAHDATLEDGPGRFTTGNLTSGRSKAVTFKTVGTFDYICTIHPYMKGTVTVTR